MDQSLEIIHSNYTKKFAAIESLFKYSEHDLCRNRLGSEHIATDIVNNLISAFEPSQIKADVDEYISNFRKIEKEYHHIETISYGDYFSLDDNNVQSDIKRREITDRFNTELVSAGFEPKLDSIVKAVKNYIVDNDLDVLGNLQGLLKEYESYVINNKVKKIDYKICPSCSGKMTIYSNTSEIRCDECPYVALLKGDIFDEMQGYNQEGGNSIAKRDTYETHKRCKFHLDRILGIKDPHLDPIIYEKLNNLINSGRYLRKYLTYEAYRDFLKQLGLTKLNEHIPFIRSKLSGIKPPQLSHEEISNVYIGFDKAVTAYEEIKKKEGKVENVRYYPFFISRIIEMQLNKSSDKKRRCEILKSIHYQSEKTIIEHERLWKAICALVPGFIFKTTDMSLYRKSYT